ncbi:PHP domain-containing protein [Proteiniborus sp. MB09-C3]|uniref:PHP domain-containing protein n=1 Tax=Proteiniborus sp. MB09-C3 TaxID=3050072 RepID=UPI002552F2F0|nr:PHP domain-containing protein [Proteiniborus sp. MB09-C3]WIV10572.1 PHP domain-containing protein [Proteiniborus sp. MB09-C3]
MKIAYDLHIHSALSPCGDNDMTPNNIVNMAYLKGLNVIAITDHNSMLNVIPAIEVANMRGILVVPGIEVTTREEVHVLCYFSTIEDGMSFQDLIYDSLPNILNKEEIFGEQLLFDNEDNIVGKIDKMLLSSSKYSIGEIFNLVKIYNGVLVPAHIDKSSFSILSTLGFIPSNIDIKTIEIFDLNRLGDMTKALQQEKYRIIKNSDAHYLASINEADYYMDLDTLTAKSIVDYLKGGL